MRIIETVAIGFIVFALIVAGCFIVCKAQAAIKVPYTQASSGLTKYFNLDSSYSDEIYAGMLHYGSTPDKQMNVLISEYNGKVTQVMLTCMECSPVSYSSADDKKYWQLAHSSFHAVMHNLFGNDDAAMWAKLRRNDLMSYGTPPGTQYTKTFNGMVVRVYSVFMSQCKRGFNVVSIT